MRLGRTATILSAMALAMGGVTLSASPALADEGPCADIPAGINVIVGNALNNVLIGGPGPDLIIGGPGNDVIFGAGGNDFLFGGDGNDELYGNDGNDCIDGDNGWDEGFGNAGANLCTTPATEVQVNC